VSRDVPNGGDVPGLSNFLLTMHARNETYRGAGRAHLVTR